MNGAVQPLPRVLIVEDDLLARRYVVLALEGLPVEVVECGNVSEARQRLSERSARLVITDLGLPGESGVALLEDLANNPALRGDARVAVFSAAVDAQRRAQLKRLGVWRILPKPISLAALEACAAEALEGADVVANEGASTFAVNEAAAIAEHFAGDAALFAAFRQSCLEQFPHDVATVDKACAEADLQALQRIVHGLKTVLRSLGRPVLGTQAERIEMLVQANRDGEAVQQWRALRTALLQWAGEPV